MQKFAFILLPVAALVVLAVVFSRVARREAADAKDKAASKQGASPEAGTSPEVARLQKQVDDLVKEAAAQRKRAETAEAKLAEAASESATAASDEKKAAPKKPDWKTRRDSELEAKVKSMEWRRNVKGVIAYWKELEAARLEGRSPQYSPELMGPLNALQADMGELAKFLGIEGGNTYDVFKNGLVGEAWQDAFFQEIGGGALTEGQLAKLRATSLYESDDEDWQAGAGNILEQWSKLIEHNRAYGTETAGILTQEQHALVAKTVTPTYMLSLYAGYSERTMTGTGPDVAQSVANYWLKSFNLPEDQRAVVEAAAAEYVRRQAEIAQAVSNQHGGLKSRDAEYDLLVRTIEAQIAVEKKLSETLHLDPEQAKKLLKGSGAVIRIPY
jgi:hypothetical protein